MQMNHSVLRVLGTAVAVQMLCVVAGVLIIRHGMIPTQAPAVISSAALIGTLKDDLVQASLAARLRDPSIAPVLVEQALTNMVRQEIHAYLRGQPSIPPDPAEQLSEEVRERAFHIIEARIDAAIAAGEWSQADTAALAPHLASITDKQRTALADRINRAIADRRMKPTGLLPPL